MAEARDQLQKLTECCICFQEFTDPRMLPCIHTFCLECLKQTGDAAKKKPGEKMPCPLCRTIFVIPAKGMNGLQKNFFMQHLMDVTTMIQLGQKPVIDCDICRDLHEGDEEKTTEATMRCLECEDNLCDMCSKIHKLQRLSKTHNIVKIGSETEEDIRKMQTPWNCSFHNQQPLNLYCIDCKEIICVSCFVENHKLHDCKDVNTIHTQFRQTIVKEAGKISKCVEEIISKGRMMEQRRTEELLNLAETEDKIRQRNLELKEMIDSHTNCLLEELLQIKRKQLKNFACDKEEIDRNCVIFKSFETYCTELIAKGSDGHVCSCVGELIARANELETDHKAFIGRPFQMTEVSFKNTELRKLLSHPSNNMTGRIECRPTSCSFGFLDSTLISFDDATSTFIGSASSAQVQSTSTEHEPDAWAVESSYTKQPGRYTENVFPLEERMAMLKRVRTFELDGLKITNCIFKREHIEICYLLDDSCVVHDKDELTQQLADHLKIDSKMIKMAKLRAKPIYKETTLRPGDSANIYSKVTCSIGAFVHVEGKGIHALISGHGRSPGDVIRYPNGDRLGVVNISLHPSLQPNDDHSYCGYTDVALAKLEQQDRYIAQVYSAIHGQLYLMEQPAEAHEDMVVRCFDANGTRGIVESTAYIRQDEELKLDWRLISISNDAGGPVHKEGESGILIVCDTPDQRRVKAVGILVGVDELLFDDEEETIRTTSLAVPLTISFEGLQDDPYCNRGAIKFLH